MKIDRLLAIITTLLHTKKATYNQLAEKFEVSKRTIQRDIETLSKAGIPVYSISGANGGIFLLDEYVLNKEILKKQELATLLIGLESLSSVMTSSHEYHTLLEKLTPSSQKITLDKHITVNLASYYKNSLSEKIDLIHSCIVTGNIISFIYYSINGQTQKNIMPFHLTFQWESWYIWGKEMNKNEPRLYKLNRLWNLKRTNHNFSLEQIPQFEFNINEIYKERFILKALFSPLSGWRLVEEYGPDSFTQDKEGMLIFERAFDNEDYCLQWLLSFGKDVTIIEPFFLREKIIQEYEQSLIHYK